MENNKLTYEELLKENEFLKQQINQKNNLEKELEKAQILMRAAFDQSPVPMVVASYPDFTFKIINKATEQFLLVDAADYLNKLPLDIEWNWQEFMPDGTRITNMAELPLPKAMQGTTTLNCEMRIERKDGTSVWELASASPVYDREGNLIAGILAMVDITERKAIEKILEHNKQQLQHQNSVYELLNEKLRLNNEEVLISKEKAEKNEAKFKSYIDNAPDGVFLVNEKGEYLEANRAACKITGYSESELLKMTIPQLIHKDSLLKAQQHFQKVVENGISSDELAFITKNNEKRFWSVDAVKLSETCFLGFAKDITKRKQAEEELLISKEKAEESKTLIEKQLQELQAIEEEIRASNEELAATTDALIESNAELLAAKVRAEENEIRFKALFDNMNNMASHYEVVYDTNGIPCDYRFLNINACYQKNIGLKPNDVIGKTLLEVFPATELLWLETFKQVVLTGEPAVIESYSREVDMYFELIVYVPEKGKLALIGSDVTERKRGELELLKAKQRAEESEEKYRALYNNAPLSYQSLDENGCFIDINPMWIKTLGYEKSEIIGKWYGDFLHPDYVEHFRINFPAFKKRGYVSDVQFKLRKKDNTFVYVSFEGCIGYTPEGKFKQTYCVFKDITEQKALENDLKKSKQHAEESDQLKTAFLENISHELRTPMNAILGFSELLVKKELSLEKRQQFTSVLHKATHQLLNVVENTITLAHIETNQLHINRINFLPTILLANLLAEFNIKKQILEKDNIQLNTADNGHADLSIYNDYTRIHEIFTILLDNALKFTHKGAIEFGFATDTGYVNFYVKDTGIGIPPEKQQIIFKSFTQSDKNIRQLFGGLGVGLSIALSLINLMNGKIEINSEVNVGTKIIFSLPIE